MSGKRGGKWSAYNCSMRIYNKATRTELGCTTVIRATKQCAAGWKTSSVDLDHVNCAGSTTIALSGAVHTLVDETLWLNPTTTGDGLKKTVQILSGAPFPYAARGRSRNRGDVHVHGVTMNSRVTPLAR